MPRPGSNLEQGSQIALLNRRLDRERASRKAAEALLTDKSRELFDALTLMRDSEHRLQMAFGPAARAFGTGRLRAGRLNVQGLLLAGEPYDWPEPDLQNLLPRFIPTIATQARWPGDCIWPAPARTLTLLTGCAARADCDGCGFVAGRWSAHRTGYALRLAGTIKDITNQRRSEQSLNLMAHAFASTQDALAVVDQTGWIIEINNALVEMTGTEQEILLGMPLSDYLDLPFEAYIEAGWRGESQLRGEAEKTPVEVTVTTVSELAGQARCFIVSMHDISERQRAATRLARLALVDTLTELPNRAALEKRLEHDIAAAKCLH